MYDKIIRLFPQFVKDINRIQPKYSLSDQIWQLPMRFGPGPNDCTVVHVTLYEEIWGRC